jgi:uncharacterized delta-60 repeat protein
MRARFATRLSLILVGILALAIVVATPITAAPGDLDPTFDGDGRVTTNLLPVDEARGVAVQADGRIVAAGVAICPPCATPFTPHLFALARYNRDGSLDPTFDGDGKVTTDFDAREDEAFGVAIQADGKIIAAGSAFGPEAQDFALARYNPDGSLDSTFDGDGMVTSDFAGGADEARGVVTQADGKIVAAGVATVAGTHDFAVARFNVDGSLDPTFGLGGKVTTDFDFDRDEVRGLVLQADGRIVAAGVANITGPGDGPSIDNFALARYNPDGSLDTTFDGDGLMTTRFASGSAEAHAVDIQGDGRIVAAGSAISSGAPAFALARYDGAGALDPTFDGDGKVTTRFAGFGDEAHGVAIQGDGKIVAAGLACSGCFAGGDFGVARYNTDGSLDTIFSGDGLVMTDFGFADDQAFAVALQGDGKIVAAGVAGGDFALARYKVCRVSSRRSSIPCR